VEPWLSFIGRDKVWNALKSTIGVGLPKESNFHVDPGLPKSVALLVVYDDRKDNPHELVRGVSHHLYVEGHFENALDASGKSESLDEHWTDIKSFGWPGHSGGMNGVLLNILLSLNMEVPDHVKGKDLSAQEFVKILAEIYQSKRMSPCLLTTLGKKSTPNDLKLALEFASLWSGLDWSALPCKLLLTIAVRTSDVPKFLRTHRQSATACEALALISADCMEEWIEGFLRDRLRIDNLPIKPVWWQQVRQFEPAEDFKKRFDDIKPALNL
jgi:hypothetical protein